ncbi:3-deoxy-7-phosphoheptulonate synthase [Caldisalinibacter kiritimatiensis]|uniref:2-keto-3-deoxy-D-arabino-heptulosonate-7-phosphate synthase I beta n=1 Tax=Caldisalinibacter kiritimatiensis TaxID=1304284 RepID=R1AX99_9FIRM|nr:3-deoxy-7-phosphoheptulonate synthase [Caldisalinibacter kiritimatiensis]EOD01292.1 2-keto-3-deoxy-D-arabino-heptulosonate-7- phosphate synthase I beta [Caldisalinibacter kiritimatiensis]
MDIKKVGKINNSKKVIDIGDNIKIGGDNFVIIAGPCAVENEEQVNKTAEYLNKLGVKILRGGAFKPRTSPYSFQGLGFKGLKLLKNAAKSYNMKVISEIMDPRDIENAYEYVDIFQIGSRNMQNFSLLKEIGKVDKPVLLKRGMAATVEEWLMAAEYIALEGNENIILCERGIRTFENYTRNTLDLTAVPIIKDLSCLPIIVDPSHGTGRRNLVIPMSRAAVAVGADGLIIEVHPNPSEALSDGEQSLDFVEIKKLIHEINSIKTCINKFE